MANNFLDEVLDKVGEQYVGGQGFEAGTHKVTIMLAESTKDSKDRDIIKVSVVGAEDENQTAEATLWFHTEGGAKMSVTKVLGLLVHNVGEEKKEQVRNLGKKVFGSADSPAKAQPLVLKLINEKLLGKEGFLVATPTGNYSTTKYGDLWHYPAESQATKNIATAQEIMGGGEVMGESELPDLDEL